MLLLLTMNAELFGVLHRLLRLLVVLLLFGNLHRVLGYPPDFPCGKGWRYSSRSGKCYFFSNDAKTWDEANSACSSYGSPEARGGKTTLTKLVTYDDIQGLRDVIISNMENQWTAGYLDTTAYQLMWNSTHVVNGSLFEIEKHKPLGAEKVVVRYEDRMVNGEWTFSVSLALKKHDDKFGYYCEYKAKSCPDPENQVDYVNKTTMQFVPERFTVATHVHIACQPGFYRTSALTNPGNPGENNLINCTGTASADFDPEQFSPKWKINGSPEDCKSVSCPKFSQILKNVGAQPDLKGASSDGTYEFGHKLHVNCSKGFVGWQDPNKVTSYMLCQQSTARINYGKWHPRDYQPCQRIRCNMTEMLERKPVRGRLVKATNLRTREVLTAYQMNAFNVYDNIVVIRCDDGYFFSDRSYEKKIICGLKDEISLTEGKWAGYQGTSYPTPPVCQAVTCRHEDVLIDSSHFIRSYFHVWTTAGDVVNKTDQDGTDYPYRTTIRFFCEEGYESANGNADLNITCGPQGDWEPRLTPCIEIRPKLDTGQRKRYEPPPQDAPAAREVGATAIVIMVIFFALIIILDLTTVTRDIKVMRKNLRYLKKRMNENKVQ